MLTVGPPFGQAQVCIILFASFVLAVLQNVTVDDAVLSGAVIPTYLPSQSNWNQGNNCSGCLARPDPSMVFNGTWHDTTFSPTSSMSQGFEFTFTGSALYIFFILANNVPYATTLTHVEFVLDGAPAFSFTHTPSMSTSYEYNQTVYANSSIAYGQHTMRVMPVNDSVNGVLMLFDYLIYTVGTDSVTPPAASASSGAPPTSFKPNVGALVGGTVAGVAVLLLLITSLLCCRRYKRQLSSTHIAVVEPFVLSSHTAPTPPVTEVREHAEPASLACANLSHAQPVSRSKTWALAPAVPSSIPSSTAAVPITTTAASSSDARSHGVVEILEQVELLRDEVARLRRVQVQSWNTSGVGSQPPPPQYS